MDRAFITLVFSICFVQISLGLPSLTCDDVDPILLSTMKCSCQNVGGTGIRWYREGVFLTSCTLLSGQCFTSMGYTFTVDSTTSTYTIEFGSYNYTDCTNLQCSDSTTPSESDFQHILVNVTKYSPTLSLVNEPSSSHMNGNIDFTTDCIYKANSTDIYVTAMWTAVVNGTEEDELDIKGTISKTGSCQFCIDDFASKISVSYTHQEEQSKSRIKAKIRLKLLIDKLLHEETTKNEYYVKGKNESPVSNTTTTSITNSTSDVIKITTTNSDKNVRSGHTSKPWCCFDIWCIIIFVVVGLAISYIPAVVIRCNKQRFYEVIKGCNLWILIIPFVGLILIIIYCFIFCKGCCRKCKVSGCYRKNTDIPDKPKEFTVDPNSVTSKSVWLSWISGPKKGSEHIFNLIWYTDDGNERCVDIPHNGKNKMRHKLEDLLGATNYNVKIFAECNTVKLECDTKVHFKTKEDKLRVFRKKHKRIADSCEDEICCENCKKTGASLASHAYCLSDELYLCLKCLDKEHTNEECVLLWNTDDIKGKDHKLCCKENYKRDDLQLKGVCQTCKLFICSQCIEKHEHTDCSSHQQLHGPLNTRARMCCKRNKAKGRTETVDFCMQCKTFICASCLEHHNTHLVISNLKDVMDAETGFCCELNYKARGHESDDFCIQCKTFICASCLKEHTNHVVISAFTGLISTRAGMCCKLENNNKIKDFCIQCQTFICDPCKKNHNRHIIVSSMMASSKRKFFCKGCPSVKRLPVECLALHKGVFLCASCYETGNLKKALKNKSESQEPIVQNFTKNQKSCQVHEVLGNVKDLQVEVYCLVCQLYMCLGCFKKHRRIYDHWSKTLEGNLFYCNQCRTGELNPVECCDFTSLEFRCWQCYILNIRTSAKLSYTKEVTSKMHDLRDMKNPCQVHEDESRSTTKADVYCLVCKSDMCKSCFKKHINSEINQR